MNYPPLRVELDAEQILRLIVGERVLAPTTAAIRVEIQLVDGWQQIVRALLLEKVKRARADPEYERQ